MLLISNKYSRCDYRRPIPFFSFLILFLRIYCSIGNKKSQLLCKILPSASNPLLLSICQTWLRKAHTSKKVGSKQSDGECACKRAERPCVTFSDKGGTVFSVRSVFEQKNRTSIFTLVPTWQREQDSFSAEKPAHGSFVPPARNSLPFASNPRICKKKKHTFGMLFLFGSGNRIRTRTE